MCGASHLHRTVRSGTPACCSSRRPAPLVGICARCALRDDLNDLLAPGGDSRPELAALVEAFCTATRPESVITWKRNPAVTALLTDIGTGALALSHEALDQVPASRAAEHLREMLVHHGLLPARDPDLAKFERWLQARLDSIEPAAVRQPLERFATWHHLRRIRARSRQGEAVHGAVHCAKQEITETGRLLAWLHQQGLTLAECTQGRLEEWLTSGPSTRTAARTFINWARSNRSAGDIEIPARTARSTPLITHEARLDLLRRCLVEEPDTLTYRVAAALLLLYAQPMSRVAAMRIEQINVTGERLTLVLENEPAEVPPPFADLLLDLVANRPNLQTGNAGTSPWLFPSTRPGQHLHPNTITIRLRAMGIELLGARNAALRELVQQVPPPIVASQLGYSPRIALRHASLAAQPTSAYASRIGRQS